MRNIRILFRGLWRSMLGALVVSGAAAAWYGYTLIPTGGVYESIMVLIGSTSTLITSLYLMWVMGGGARLVRKEGV